MPKNERGSDVRGWVRLKDFYALCLLNIKSSTEEITTVSCLWWAAISYIWRFHSDFRKLDSSLIYLFIVYLFTETFFCRSCNIELKRNTCICALICFRVYSSLALVSHVWPEYLTPCWPTPNFLWWSKSCLLIWGFFSFLHLHFLLMSWLAGRALNAPTGDIDCYVRNPKSWSVCVNLVPKDLFEQHQKSWIISSTSWLTGPSMNGNCSVRSHQDTTDFSWQLSAFSAQCNSWACTTQCMSLS